MPAAVALSSSAAKPFPTSESSFCHINLMYLRKLRGASETADSRGRNPTFNAMARRQPLPPKSLLTTIEGRRIYDARHASPWRHWGPYLSERQWGTVREDYSPHGDAWHYLPHDHARSRAYRWGEDGIGGFGDSHLRWCFALALWNERDPILKERLFGLTNAEGNHGEDVKELYYYTDGIPSHAYMRMLYKYPQNAFPYDVLVKKNKV